MWTSIKTIFFCIGIAFFYAIMVKINSFIDMNIGILSGGNIIACMVLLSSFFIKKRSPYIYAVMGGLVLDTITNFTYFWVCMFPLCIYIFQNAFPDTVFQKEIKFTLSIISLFSIILYVYVLIINKMQGVEYIYGIPTLLRTVVINILYTFIAYPLYWKSSMNKNSMPKFRGM
ncbi:hypothetical protein ACFL56_01905 [Candidatus Margulisiibacteriota bacterium]